MNIEQPLTLSSTAQNAINSPLLKLPAELRHQIYVYVIDASSNNNASYHMNKEYFRHAAMQRDRMRKNCLNTEPNCHCWLGLLSACRQTYHEAGWLPLSLNILYFPSRRAFDAFLNMASQHRYPPPTLRLRITQETHRQGFWGDKKSGLGKALPTLERVEIAYARRKFAGFVERAKDSRGEVRVTEEERDAAVRSFLTDGDESGIEVVFRR
jgi:hypothetical protein